MPTETPTVTVPKNLLHTSPDVSDAMGYEYERAPRQDYETVIDSATATTSPPVSYEDGVRTRRRKTIHASVEVVGADGTKEAKVRWWGRNDDVRIHQELRAPGPPISPAATDLPTALVLVNEEKALYNVHIASTVAHKAADSNAVTSPDAVDQTSAETLANEIKAKHNVHRASLTYHFRKDDETPITSADASDLNTLKTLVNELATDLGAHFLYGGKWFCLGPYGQNETTHRLNENVRIDYEGHGLDAAAAELTSIDSGLEVSVHIMPG